MTDWRLPADYDSLAGLSRAGQAFEFLRRHPGYRKDYRDVLERRARRAAREEGQRDGWRVSTGDPDPWVTLTPLEQAMAESDPQGHRLIAPGPGESARMDFEDYVAWKYGLDQPLLSPDETPQTAPRFLPDDRFPFLPDAITARELFYSEDPTEEPAPVVSPLAVPHGQLIGLALLCFDLTRPITGQMKRADAILKALQRQQVDSQLIDKRRPGVPNYDPAHLVVLLRVWDAVQAGVTKEEVFEHLVEEDEQLSQSENPTATVNGWLEQANTLIHGGYRRLAHAAPP